MIILRNEGEIDIDVIKLMGVNVKESGNAIGFFGTGLKYAIAVFLREGLPVKLYAGDVEYQFLTETKKIRGKEFQICRMHSPMDFVDLGFTTELGKNWKLWQAYREIHSNCLDEGGVIYRGEGAIGRAGYTAFVLPEMDTSGIFLADSQRELLFSNDDIEIYAGASKCIYYKGIRAKDLYREAKFTYNIKRSCDLTEDRLLCYDFQIEYVINDAVAQMDNKEIIKDVITARDTYEASLRMHSNTHAKPAAAFLEVFHENIQQVNSGAKDYVTNNTPRPELSPEQKRQAILREFEGIAENHGLLFAFDGSAIVISGHQLLQQDAAA